MKKIFTILLAVISALSTFAHDFEVDGIFYKITSASEPYTVAVSYKGEYSNSYYNEYSGTVIIPSTVTYEGTTYAVTSIGAGTFSNCNGLTSITIPNSVTSIEYGAFEGCRGLTSVTIPNSVTSIGAKAFSNCYDLTSITIPNTITSIEESTFESCIALTSITIPNTVTSIGGYAFYGCGLTSITIPESVTSIGNRAFYGCGLTSVTLNAKNCTVAGSVFRNCSALSKVIIGEEVETIPANLFYNCRGLTSIEIPNSVTSIGYAAFSNCNGLTSVTIGNSVTSIGPEAFLNCSGLTSIEIPNTVTSIGNNAFADCTGLTSIEIPNSVTSIGRSAFGGCRGLTSIEIPNSVTSIGGYAFSNCNGLTSVTIGNSVTSIGESAFRECSNLAKVEISDLEAWCGINFIITQYSDETNESNPLLHAQHLYLNGEEVRNLVIPEGVTEIKSRAFYNCSGLESVTIPASVTYIGSDAFAGCTNLSTVYNCSGMEFYPGWSGYGYVSYYATDVYGCPATIQEGVNNSEWGSVTVEGMQATGSVLVLTATPAEGYAFVQWSDGVTDNPRMVTVTGDMEYTAEFGLLTYTITTIAEYGTITGGGSYVPGTEITLTVTPDEGYVFTQWSDGVTDNPRTVTVAEDATYMAELMVRVTIDVETNNAEYGNVAIDGEVEIGSEIVLTATANEGYEFVQWSDGNTDNPRTVTVTDDATYTAVFAEINTAVEDVATEGFSAYAVDGTVYCIAEEFQIFTIGGTNVTNLNGNLPAGVYVVVGEKGRAKVVVK